MILCACGNGIPPLLEFWVQLGSLSFTSSGDLQVLGLQFLCVIVPAHSQMARVVELTGSDAGAAVCTTSPRLLG